MNSITKTPIERLQLSQVLYHKLCAVIHLPNTIGCWRQVINGQFSIECRRIQDKLTRTHQRLTQRAPMAYQIHLPDLEGVTEVMEAAE